MIGCGGRIGDHVDTVALVEYIGVTAVSAHQAIVARPSDEPMVASPRVQTVVSTTSPHESTPGSGENNIVKVCGSSGSFQKVGQRGRRPVKELQRVYHQ